MCGMCSNFGSTLLVILAATFLVIWSAGQAKGKLGKIIGSIILVIGALAFVYQAYVSISLGCKTGTCPMMNMMGYQNSSMNMPMMQHRPMMQKKMQMNQPFDNTQGKPFDNTQGGQQNSGQ